MLSRGNEISTCSNVMAVTDHQWELWKRSGEQFDDRVVEVVWDKTQETWICLRFRDDTTNSTETARW